MWKTASKSWAMGLIGTWTDMGWLTVWLYPTQFGDILLVARGELKILTDSLHEKREPTNIGIQMLFLSISIKQWLGHPWLWDLSHFGQAHDKNLAIYYVPSYENCLMRGHNGKRRNASWANPGHPPVIKHGYLENPPFSLMIFPAINLHLVRGFSSQPRLATGG